jgi:hypothetical protein
MEFKVRELQRNEKSMRGVVEICSQSFGGMADNQLKRLRTNWFDSSPESVFFGAFIGEKLVAVNGFIAHVMLVNGQRGIAYQSCWSATLQEFRGNGLFSKIIEYAKFTFRGSAAFIFGFPNKVSGPIFVGKLGFREIPIVRAVFMTRGPVALLQSQISSSVCFRLLADANLVKFDQWQNSDWKRFEHGADLVEVEHNTNYLWGTVAVRSVAGVKVRVLIAGGCEINKPLLFGELLRAAAKSANISFIRIATTRGGVLSGAARFVLSGDRTEPFIYYPIDIDADGLCFDAFTGLKDVF